MAIITSDNQEFNLPTDYYSGSNYLKAVESYKDNEFLSSTSPPVQFSLEEMELLNISINILDHNQVLVVHSIDQFFQHQDRLDRVELRLTSLWIMGFYTSADVDTYQYINSIVNEIIFNNVSCAVKVYLRDRHHSFYNHKWTTLKNRIYWIDVRESILEYVEVEDLHLVDKKLHRYQFSRHIRTIERLDTYLNYLNYKGTINLAIRYVSLIRGHSSNPIDSMMAMIRFEDLTNPQLNRLYHQYILGYWKCKLAGHPHPLNSSFNNSLERKEYTTDDYINSLRGVEPSSDNVLTIFSNNDERVILHVITILGKHGIKPSRSMLSRGTISPASIRLLELEEFAIIDNTNIDRILKMEDDISEVECLSIFEFDEELAHLLAGLGGRVRYSDLTMHNINVMNLQFVMSYAGDPSDSDVEHIRRVASSSSGSANELLSSIGIQCEKIELDVIDPIELGDEVLETIDRTISINRYRPAGISSTNWQQSIETINHGDIDNITIEVGFLCRKYPRSMIMIYLAKLLECMRDTGNTEQYISEINDIFTRIIDDIYNSNRSYIDVHPYEQLYTWE